VTGCILRVTGGTHLRGDTDGSRLRVPGARLRGS